MDKMRSTPATAVVGAPIGRRVFFAMLGLGAAGVLVGQDVQHGLSRALAPLREAGLGDLVPGAGGFVDYTVTSGFPSPPPDYALRVGGLVDRPLVLGLDDVRAMPAVRLTALFQCVTGWSVADVHWVGVRLTTLAEAAGIHPRAAGFAFRSFDGVYTESLSRSQAEESGALVAYDMLGAPLTRDHGGPLRLYVPGMFGYKSIKWLSQIDAVDHLAPGYWEQRGYPINAWIDGYPPSRAR